ncbi:MAG: amidohydrolase [Longimicrobiales bacterium]|nr:amidohydrolase [Longimicrobiales bacterium]
MQIDRSPPPLFVLGRIATLDPRRPEAEAMAVRAGRIVAVGSIEEVRAALPHSTPTLDLGEASVLPGFIDAHLHLVDGGLSLTALDLSGVRARSEWDARVTTYLAGHTERWLLGGGWDHEVWGGELPTRDWLDRHTGDRPALLTRSDLHLALANSAALHAAGIDHGGKTADPEGGRIVRDDAGEPSGLLCDTAIQLVQAEIPELGEDDEDAALDRAIAHALRHGVTQVHDMGSFPPSWRDLEVLERAEATGRLTLRVAVATPIEEWGALADRIGTRGRGTARLRWGMAKGFVDGSLGAGTARFHETLDDLPGRRGLVVTDLEALRADIVGAWGAGIQPLVHAIGDAAVDWLTDVYARLGPGDGAAPPPRIEHVQHLSPGAAERIAASRAIASMQPCHLVADAPWLERRVGASRARRAYAIRSLEAAGVPLAFGSDWTVAPLDPLASIRAAIGRRDAEGHPFHPDERVSFGSALAACTRGAAAAGGFRHETGVLAPGRRADFVVVEGLPHPHSRASTDPEVMKEARVARTFIDGEQLYPRETTEA